eukprot:7454928-Pyramimonas_sp.AAC.1
MAGVDIATRDVQQRTLRFPKYYTVIIDRGETWGPEPFRSGRPRRRSSAPGALAPSAVHIMGRGKKGERGSSRRRGTGRGG